MKRGRSTRFAQDEKKAARGRVQCLRLIMHQGFTGWICMQHNENKLNHQPVKIDIKYRNSKKKPVNPVKYTSVSGEDAA